MNLIRTNQTLKNKLNYPKQTKQDLELKISILEFEIVELQNSRIFGKYFYEIENDHISEIYESNTPEAREFKLYLKKLRNLEIFKLKLNSLYEL